MVVPRHLSRAPIREAIVDVRTYPFREGLDFKKARERLTADFPKVDAIRMRTFGLESDRADFRTRASEHIRGIRLASQDGRYVVQFRSDGFTFSRLPPYETWEVLRARAAELWSVFAETAKPERVTRLAVRYINLLGLPLPIEDMGDFLVCPPDVPAELGFNVTSFLSRIVMTDPTARGTIAILTQALESPTPTTVPITLDIDVFRESESQPSADAMWATLEQLRVIKNRIFFESITERTARLFE